MMATVLGRKSWHNAVVAGLAMGAVTGAIKGSPSSGAQVGIVSALFGFTYEYVGNVSPFEIPRTERNVRRWNKFRETTE